MVEYLERLYCKLCMLLDDSQLRSSTKIEETSHWRSKGNRWAEQWYSRDWNARFKALKSIWKIIFPKLVQRSLAIFHAITSTSFNYKKEKN